MSNKSRKISAVIAAAGKSSRMNLTNAGIDESKQFAEINGKYVIGRTLEVFERSEYIHEIIVSARGCDIGRFEQLASGFSKIKSITEGGETRLESVAGAVGRVSQWADYIAVHDGARCFVTPEDIEKVALMAFETGAATAGHKVIDTIKRVDCGGNIEETLERSSLYAVQTPQIFLKERYLRALENADINAPDDCYIMERAGYIVSIAECSRYNLKVTDRQDLEFLNLLERLADSHT